jgi:hypothetical protein
MNNLPELFTLLGGVAASLFALVQLTLGQHRATQEQFIGYLQDTLRRQESAQAELNRNLASLSENVHDNTRFLRSLSERMGWD